MLEKHFSLNILIVDSSKTSLKSLKAEFVKIGGDVFMARNITDAKRFVSEDEGWADIILCNVDIGESYSGLRYIHALKQKFPGLTICLMTSQIRKHYKVLKDEIFCIEKCKKTSLIVSAVLMHWYRDKKKNQEFEARRQKILTQLPYKNSLTVLSKKPIKGAAAVDFWLKGSDPPRSIRSVFYRHPNHPLRFSCGVCVSCRCRYGCLTCLTGMITDKSEVLDLEKSQIIAQVLHGLDSSLAFGCLSNKYEISVEFTCGGDWIAKPRPVYESIVEMDSTSELNHPLFVITTIGNQKVFEEYLPKLVDYKVKIYLSVHSLDKEKRERLMLATKGQSLEDTRELLSWFANEVHQKHETIKTWTMCWMLIKGFNDSTQDIADIVQFCHGWPEIDVKVMLMDGELEGYSQCTWKELEKFVKELRRLGVDARSAVNMGSGTGKTPSNMTCGTTLSTPDIVAMSSKD